MVWVCPLNEERGFVAYILVSKVRAIIRDVDWLGPMLGRKRGGRNLLPTWVLGDTVYREAQISLGISPLSS